MSNNEIVSQVFEQVTTLPDKVDHPLVTAGSLAAAGALAAYSYGHFSKTQEEFAVNFPNPEGLKQAISDSRGNDIEGNSAKQRRRRMAPVVAGIAGLGLAVSGAAGGLKYEDETPVEGAQAVAILDSSYTMTQTKDMEGGQTRYGVSAAALAKAEYGGSLAVIETSDEPVIRIPMTKDWEEGIGSVSRATVDPNGGNMAGAIKDAMNLIPNDKKDSKDDKKPNGTILIFSDGTINNTEKQIARLGEDLKKRKIEVKVIAPGTATGKYEVAGSDPIESGVAPDSLRSVAGKNVEVASSQEDVDKAVQQVFESAGTKTKDSKWYVPLALGLGAVGLSFGMMATQRTKRVI